MDNFQKLLDIETKKNEIYLKEFKEWLKNKELTTKTINLHLDNVDLFLNYFLLHYDIVPMEKGCFEINSFFTTWFIRRLGLPTVAGVKSYASSFKKFYQCMFELNKITKEDNDNVKHAIKEYMDEWIDTVNRYHANLAN